MTMISHIFNPGTVVLEPYATNDGINVEILGVGNGQLQSINNSEWAMGIVWGPSFAKMQNIISPPSDPMPGYNSSTDYITGETTVEPETRSASQYLIDRFQSGYSIQLA